MENFTTDGRIRIAIDFDGVIHKYSNGWADGSIYDEPNEKAVETIRRLRKHGYYIIIHTSRILDMNGKINNQQVRLLTDWLAYNDVYYDEIQPKVCAITYIDDRAMRYTNWTDISNKLLKG